MMRLYRAAWRLGGAAAVAGLAVTGVVVLPTAVTDGPPAAMARHAGPTAAVAAAAGRVAAASASPASTHPRGRFNVGNTHSPRLLRQLAGPAGTSGPVINGPKAAAAAGPVSGAAQGVDVASFQHPNGAAINWQQVAGAGIKFAAVKVTEGAYYTNPFAASDLTAAKAAGLTAIGYAFAIPNGGSSGTTQFSADPAVQADDLIKALPSPMPVMLDIEYDPYAGPPPNGDGTTGFCYGLSTAQMVSWIAAFDAEVQARTGWLPIIYTTQGWWKTCTGGSTAFGQAPVWPADFSSSGSPLLPAGWGTWNLWQYTSTGSVTGISGKVDLDQVNPAMITLLNTGLNQAVPGKSTVAGSAVGAQFTASDSSGQTPAFTGAGLPPGLSISGKGLVSGWPNAPGTYHPVVTAADGNGGSGSASFPWIVSVAPDHGPTGAVALDVGGKCLNDVGDNSANGTQADIWTCNGSSAQHWTYVQDGTVRIQGKCLASPGSHPANDARVELETCTGAAVQQWWLTYPRSISASLGATPITLLNPATGMCLADPGRSTVNGTRVTVETCNGFKGQAWTLPAGPVTSRIPGMCMDDRGNGTANGTPVDLFTCNGTAAQQWTTEPDGTIRVHGMCLDVQNGGTASGTPVDLSSCSGTGAQQWHLVPLDGGTSLVNPQSALCLTDPGDATAAGTVLQITTCTGAAGQSWRDQ